MNLDKAYDLSAKVCVITGAGGKLGKYYSDIISQQGAKVICLDKKFDEDACELAKRNSNINLFSCDITSKLEVRKIFDDIEKKYGTVDILINNAAAAQTTFVEGNLVEFEEFPIEVWQANLDVNLTGTFLCSQMAGKQMLKKGSGVILNIGSTYGLVGCDQRIYGDSGLNSNCAYAATKSGLNNFTRYLAAYYEGKNIRVNCLAPGGVYNNQSDEFYNNYLNKTMIKRMAHNDDLGYAVLYLISDASSWVTGAIQTVDGGFTAW